VTGYLRDTPAEFEALRDSTSERLGVDRGAVEKDFWATEVLRSACSLDVGVEGVVFKGGTSLSKAFGLIERFSEDVDLLVVTAATGNALKRALRGVAERVRPISVSSATGNARAAGTSTLGSPIRRRALFRS
jgi:predicted nucleotidyltransferase component of viral defense system